MDSNRKTLLAFYDKEMRIDIEIPGVQKERFSNLVRFRRPPPGMNVVLYSRLALEDLDRVIGEQIAYFRPLDQPFSWHVCDHDSPAELAERLAAHGFAPDDDPDAVMVLDLLADPWTQDELPSFDIRRLTRRSQLEDIAEVEQQVWGGDFSWLPARLGNHLDIPDYLNVYAIYEADRPVSSGWVYFHPKSQFAGLFGGATLPSHRGRGLYRALLGQRILDARQRGYRFVTTGASPMSRPILERSGFRLLTWSYAYEWQGPPGGS